MLVRVPLKERNVRTEFRKEEAQVWFLSYYKCKKLYALKRGFLISLKMRQIA
jgi:hypothetical protein